MMNDQDTTAAAAATAATSTCHSASSHVAITVASSNQQQQQQQQNEEEGEKEQGFLSLTSPRETDIILSLDNNDNSDKDNDNANNKNNNDSEEQQQQHHIGNIRYQNFIDNIVSIHHHHHHHYGNNNNKELELVNNIIDTIYRNKGSFITKQEYCRRLNLSGGWSTVIDRDIIRKKVCHSLLLSSSNSRKRRRRNNNQTATAQTQSVEVAVEVAAAAAKRAAAAVGVGVTTTAMTTVTSTSTNSKRRIRNNNNDNNNNNDDDDDDDDDDNKLEELPPSSKKGKNTDKSLLPPPPPAIFTANSECSGIAFDASSAAATAAATTTTTTVPARIYDDLNDENIISDIKKGDNNDNDDEYEHEQEHEHEQHDHDHDYKYYEQLSSGCLTFGQSEENYEDIIFRSTSSRYNSSGGGDCSYNWKEQIFEDMKKIERRYNHTHAHTAHTAHATHDSSSDERSNSTNGIRLRLLFSSRRTNPQDVIDVLQYMIELNFFSNFNNNNNNKRRESNSINHLAFGLIEVVNDFELDIKPLSFPINIFGKVLKTITSMQTSSAEGTSDDGGSSDGSIPLQSLNIKNIKFIGTRNEFNTTFEQLSKCNTIKEFIFESCRFLEVNDDSVIIRNGTRTNNNTNTQLYNLMFNALQKITSLEVLSINDIPLEQCSKSFNQILLKEEDLSTMKQQQQQNRKKKKKLKVLSISECTISDSTLKIIFGSSKTNSRVEKLSLVDVISSKEQRCKLIQYIRGNNDCNGEDGDNHLTTSKNRRSRSPSLKYLSLNWINDDYFPVSQTIDLMNALEVNNSLKVLHLDVDCTSNALCDKESSFINSIQKLSGLQVLHLTLSGMSGQKGLECISSIVRNGIGQNSTLKKVDLLVSGYYHRQRTEKQMDDFRNEFSNEINSSLIHALTTTTTSSSSSSSCDDLDGDEDVCSTSVSRRSAGSCSGFGCVLEDFYLYVDGTFSIDLNNEVQFWLSMNENNLKQKLMSDLNNYKLWIDSIIEHQLDEKIVYYLLRQNPALLLFLLPSDQQNNQPNYDSMITTPTIEEVI